MSRRSFPVYDFAVFGIKGLLSNIRLFFLVSFGWIATLVATFFVMALVARPLVGKLWDVKKTFMPEFMTCVNRQECWDSFKHIFYGSVIPLFKTHLFLMIASGIIFFIVIAWLAVGIIRICLDLADEGKSSVRQLFNNFHYIPKFIIATTIVFVTVLTGIFLFVIPGIFLLARFFFFGFYIVDKDAGVIESLKKSFNATRGLGWDILAILIVAAIFKSFGSFFGVYASTIMTAAAYRKIQK